MLATLDAVMAYQHPAVINRFKKEHPEKAQQAEQLFSDLLIFFWLSKKHADDQLAHPDNDDFKFVFIMDEEMLYIDKMWHVFLLYTKDYMDFCATYFGEYLHHLPDLVPLLEKDKQLFNPEINLAKFLSYVFDNVGEEVVKRWFSHSLNAIS